jgi:endonuclease/exonuclease/phosphatase family metal-dependent hydrolase
MSKGLCGVSVFLALSAAACAVSYDMDRSDPCNIDAEPSDVSWYGPSDPETKPFLDQWCRTVGPPVNKPLDTKRFSDTAQADSLAVFSWNMDVGAGDLSAFLREEVGLSCIPGSTITGPPFSAVVVLLQEAFRWAPDLPPLDDSRLAARGRKHPPRPDADPDVVTVSDLCGLALWYVPSGRNGVDRPGKRIADKGNAVLSSLPLSDLIAIEHPFETERKVAVGASISLAGGRLVRLVNAHLETTASFHRTLLTGNQTHLQQVEALIGAVEDHEEANGGPIPTLMGGDFNSISGEDGSLKRLRKAFPDSPEWDGLTTKGPFPTDHLFFREQPPQGGGPASPFLIADSYRRIESSFSSDHRGRFAWIRVREPPG